MLDKAKIRNRIRKQREEDWIKQTLALVNKSPEETLKTFFDLANFAQKINRLKK